MKKKVIVETSIICFFKVLHFYKKIFLKNYCLYSLLLYRIEAQINKKKNILNEVK